MRSRKVLNTLSLRAGTEPPRLGLGLRLRSLAPGGEGCAECEAGAPGPMGKRGTD